MDESYVKTDSAISCVWHRDSKNVVGYPKVGFQGLNTVAQLFILIFPTEVLFIQMLS